MKEDKKKNKSKWLMTLFPPAVLAVIAAITATAAIATTTILIINNSDKNKNKKSDLSVVYSFPEIIPPDKAPDNDKNAQKIPDDNTSKLTAPDGGGSVSLEYSDTIGLNLSSGDINMHFANPACSDHDMVIQIIITKDDNKYVISQSDKLSPGYILRNMNLSNDYSRLLREGTYKGLFNILYYDTVKGEKSVVNTNIPITITVTE